MTKVAIITDQHFGARNDSIHFLDYYQKFYSECFFPTLDSHHISTVLILGDTFDRRKYVNFFSYKRAREMFFDILYQKNIQVHMLVGNHDTYYKNTNSVNSCDLLLQEYGNINVIESPKTINVHGVDICMMPWICPENEEASIKEIENTTAKICMGHFEIEGFAMYRGSPSSEGLQRELFHKFFYTFSGHYHHKSSVGDIHYLGNPYELTWQDYNDPRGFHIFDLDDYSLSFIENPNKMFFKLVYDDKEETITEITNKDFSKYANTYVKVVVVNKTSPFLFDRFMENLYKVNPIDITIAEDFIDLTEGVDDDMINQAEDTLTIVNKYIDTTTEDINKDKLKNIMRELYVEALNTDKT